MVNILRIKKEKVQVLQSGIDLNYIDSIKVGKRKNEIVYAGRLVPQKDVKMLIKRIHCSKMNEERIFIKDYW